MNCPRSTTAAQLIFLAATCLVAIAMPLALTTWAFAEEAIPSESIGEAAVDEYLIAPEPQPDPSQGDFPNSFVPRTRRDPNAALVEPTADENTDAKQPKMPQMKAWQRKQLAPHAQQGEMKLQIEILQEQLRLLRMQSAQKDAREQQATAAPLPDDAVIHFLDLHHVDAHQVAVTLQQVLGGAGPRFAVDIRGNKLIVRGNTKQIKEVDRILETLDQPSAKRPSADIQSLQLRIVWLVDGVDGRDSISRVGQPVLDALRELGFESPSVVCQQVTTLTPDEMRGGGRVEFGVPVLIRGKLWQLEGKGLVTPRADNRFAIEFSLDIKQPNSPSGQLSGSIYTPLSHYTILGTTTLVEQTDNDFNQYLSAFVVYLDRAPEFPADKSEKAKAKEDATPVEDNPFGK